MALKMWTFLGLTFMSLAIAYSYENHSFEMPNIINILNSDLNANVSQTCLEHLQEYINGTLNGGTIYLQMFDSISKFPDGILIGHDSIPGHFDECVSAVTDKFSGKHCMVRLVMKSGTKKSDLTSIYWNRNIKEPSAFKITYGICVPSTCNSTDIKGVFESLKLDDVTVDLNEKDCSVSGYRSFRTEDWITVAVLSIILTIAVGSTAYDFFQKFWSKNKKPNSLWSSFSFYTNGKRLFNISQSSSQLKCLNGIRFLSMCWVILGHSYFTYMFGAPINKVEILKIMNDKSLTFITNAFVSVDSFFFLSGLLVCLVFFRDISKKKMFDVPVAFIHRYMRLTPPFALLILIQATIISRLGNGPFWNVPTDNTEKACRESWWTGLLYVQNYLKPNAMCLGQAWYLSADMQMYWVSPLILYPILWFPSFAPYLILILTLAAAATNFSITFVNNFGPNLLLNWSLLTTNQFEKEYVPFHTRMSPWLIGLATGYIICGIQAKKIRLNLSKTLIAIGWIAAGFLFGGSIFGINRFINSEFSQLESSFYIAFHRVGWALGMAWVVVACVGGYGGPVNYLLSMDIFQPLGKLSYCNFLVHMTLQSYRMNSSRTNQYIRHFEILYFFVADVVISNMISIPVVLLFEYPFTNIDRYFFQKLVIFPLPKHSQKVEKENSEEKSEKPEKSQDVENGNVNQRYTESWLSKNYVSTVQG